MQFYLAFLRLTTRITGKGCVSAKMSPKCATLPRVFAFDHANPWEGLLVSAKMSAKCATLPRVYCIRPRQSLVARVRQNVGQMCNFISRFCIRPRQSLGRVARTSVADFDHANPWEGLLVSAKICHFTTRSVARPRQSIVIFEAWRRTVGKMCNFTSRYCIRPRQSLGRVARVRQSVAKTSNPYQRC